MSDKHYVGLDLTGFEDNGTLKPVSRVTLMVDNNKVITAGDDTGMELVADCPHATQAMADAILARMKGYQYQAYTADNANIDPAAELGDGVTAAGVYSVMSRISDSGIGYMSTSAPGQAELEDEYPMEGPITQAFNRSLADARSYIEKTSEEIRLGVEKVENELNQAKTEIDISLKGVSETVSKVEQTVNGVEESVGKLELRAGEFEVDLRNKVGNDEVITKINASKEGISIRAPLFSVNDGFSVSSTGYLRCTGGTIGGFTINGNSGLTSTYMNIDPTTGQIDFGSVLSIGGVGGTVANAYYGARIYAPNGLKFEIPGNMTIGDRYSGELYIQSDVHFMGDMYDRWGNQIPLG